MKFFREARTEGGFDNGIEMALRAVLVSPEFLFRVEQDPAGVPAGKAYRLSDLALASRLSFFLWSSIPDDELLTVAAQGKLRQPAVLSAQVKRMIADPRSSVLVTNFANQWLYLRNLPSITPDRPGLPKLSLYSDQPTMPESVTIFRKEKVRQPASHLNVS